jgi:hypothetical protein
VSISIHEIKPLSYHRPPGRGASSAQAATSIVASG